MGNLAAPVLGLIEAVDGLLAQQLRDLLQGGLLFAAQKQGAVAVAHDGIRRVLVDGLELALTLQNDGGRDLPAPDGGDQLVKVGDLPDVGKLVQQAPHMDGQAAAVEVVRLVAQEVEKLGVHEGRHKVEGAVRVREDDEQGRFPVAQRVQLQLVIGRQFPQLLK